MQEDEIKADDDAAPKSTAPMPGITPGGYEYEVVGGNAAHHDIGEPTAPASKRGGGVPLWGLVLAAVVPAVLVGALMWFLFGRPSDGSNEAVTTTSSGLLNAFTAGGDAETRRFEGTLPPGFPDDTPLYDVDVVASVLQVSDQNAGFIVVQHSDADRDAIGEDLRKRFDEDPWQLEGGQENRDATLYQFSRVDDAAVSGIVLLTQSKDGSRTTIITSIQDAEGADDIEDEAFVLGSARNVPARFPSELAPLPDSTLIESAFQRESGRTSYAMSYLTTTDAEDVVEYYRDTLEAADLTVEEGDPANSQMEDAQVLAFSSEDESLQGEVAIGTFDVDDSFTRIDVQVGDSRDEADADNTPSGGAGTGGEGE